MECHDGISDWIEELNSIKKKERDNGIKMGKKRKYFKRELGNMSVRSISNKKSKNTKMKITNLSP